MDNATHDRVLREKVELDERISNLVRFINGVKFPDIDEENQNLLYKQLEHMMFYARVLRDRLYNFKSSKQTTAVDDSPKEHSGQVTMDLQADTPEHGAISADDSHIYDKEVRGWISVDSRRGMDLYNMCYKISNDTL